MEKVIIIKAAVCKCCITIKAFGIYWGEGEYIHNIHNFTFMLDEHNLLQKKKKKKKEISQKERL